MCSLNVFAERGEAAVDGCEVQDLVAGDGIGDAVNVFRVDQSVRKNRHENLLSAWEGKRTQRECAKEAPKRNWGEQIIS